MSIRIKCCCVAALLFGLVPLPLAAQSSEVHETEQLSAAEVGPYRPTQQADLAATEQQIFKATNRFREEEDLGKLRRDKRLDATARDFAGFMARQDLYGHAADERQAGERARAHDYKFCTIAENIAYRFATRGFTADELAEQLFEGWKESPGHRQNMLRPYVTETGIGVAQSEETGVFYAVQLVGRPREAAIPFEVVNQTSDEIEYRVEDKEFSLPSQFTRRHLVCVPPQFEFLNDGKTISKRQSTSPTRFVVSSQQGALRVGAEAIEKETENADGERAEKDRESKVE